MLHEVTGRRNGVGIGKMPLMTERRVEAVLTWTYSSLEQPKLHYYKKLHREKILSALEPCQVLFLTLFDQMFCLWRNGDSWGFSLNFRLIFQISGISQISIATPEGREEFQKKNHSVSSKINFVSLKKSEWIKGRALQSIESLKLFPQLVASWHILTPLRTKTALFHIKLQIQIKNSLAFPIQFLHPITYL